MNVWDFYCELFYYNSRLIKYTTNMNGGHHMSINLCNRQIIFYNAESLWS